MQPLPIPVPGSLPRTHRKPRSSACTAEGSPGSRHGLESRLFAGRPPTGDWHARHRPALVDPAGLGRRAAQRECLVSAPGRLSKRRLLAGRPNIWPPGIFDGTLTIFDIAATVEDQAQRKPGLGRSIRWHSSPRAATVAAGDWDGWVRFHGHDAIANRRPLKYPARIWAIAVSPDGRSLAVGGEANTIQVYDLATRELKVRLVGHDHAVGSLDFSPDGKLLASAGGNTVRLWDTATWTECGHIQHYPEMLCVRFSPDGKLLAISDGESDLAPLQGFAHHDHPLGCGRPGRGPMVEGACEHHLGPCLFTRRQDPRLRQCRPDRQVLGHGQR